MMAARQRLQARPAERAERPERSGAQTVRFSMARSVRFSVAIDNRVSTRVVVALASSIVQNPAGVGPGGGRAVASTPPFA